MVSTGTFGRLAVTAKTATFGGPQTANGQPTEITSKTIEEAGVVATGIAVERAVTQISDYATSAVAGFLFLGSWGVVALSMYIISRVALSEGFHPVVAAGLAAPAVIVPAWKTMGAFKRRTLDAALRGHLWVLNGSVGWVIVALTVTWWVSTLRDAHIGANASMLIGLLTVGFFPLFGALVMLNRWWFTRSQQ